MIKEEVCYIGGIREREELCRLYSSCCCVALPSTAAPVLMLRGFMGFLATAKPSPKSATEHAAIADGLLSSVSGLPFALRLSLRFCGVRGTDAADGDERLSRLDMGTFVGDMLSIAYLLADWGAGV